jgi:hypothetical protein
MLMKSEVVVTGMKASKGQMDGGQAYDSTKVFVETSLDESKGTAKGTASADYTLGTSDEYTRFKHLVFPFKAMAEFELITTGKVQRMMLRSLVPVPAAPHGTAKA